MIDTHMHGDSRSSEDFGEMYLSGIDVAITCAFYPYKLNNESTLLNHLERILNYDTKRAKKYGLDLKVALGIHPANTSVNPELIYENLYKWIENKQIVAIGEIGLDYHYTKKNKEKQKELFIKQIQLANKYNLPIVIHSRDAVKDTIDILKNYKSFGVIHCFSESKEVANEYIKLGYKLGIGGVLTFKNSNLKDVIKDIPLENIVLETDSPFLSPIRGSANEPKNIKLIAECLSNIKNITISEVAKKTTDNVCKVFNIM